MTHVYLGLSLIAGGLGRTHLGKLADIVHVSMLSTCHRR